LPGEDLLELAHRTACPYLVSKVAVEKLFAGLAVEPPPARVASSLTERSVKAPAQEVAGAPSATDGLQDPSIDQLR
jgi:hypothetical protein